MENADWNENPSFGTEGLSPLTYGEVVTEYDMTNTVDIRSVRGLTPLEVTCSIECEAQRHG